MRQPHADAFGGSVSTKALNREPNAAPQPTCIGLGETNKRGDKQNLGTPSKSMKHSHSEATNHSKCGM